jgi:hypothetical protein
MGLDDLVSKIIVQDEFTQTFDKYGQQLDGVERQQQKLNTTLQSGAAALKGLAAAALAGGALSTIAAQAREAIDLAREQAAAEAQLAAVLESTGHAAGLTSDELKSLASSLQATTNFGDEATIRAEALLLTFTKIGRDVFPQATQTMLDMSAALDQDLKSSAIQLGKALNDPINGISALSRVGVSFTDAQKEQVRAMQEAGDIAGAQALILAELAREFGGAAAAARDADGGFQAAANAVGDLQEVIGAQLVPATAEYNRLVREGAEGWAIAITNATTLAAVYRNLAEDADGGSGALGALATVLKEELPKAAQTAALSNVPLLGSLAQLGLLNYDSLEQGLTLLGNWGIDATQAAVGQEAFAKALADTIGPAEEAARAEQAAADAAVSFANAIDQVAASRAALDGQQLGQMAEQEAARFAVAEKYAGQRIRVEEAAGQRIAQLQRDLASTAQQAAADAASARLAANEELARDIGRIEADLAANRQRAVEDFARNAAELSRQRAEAEAQAARRIEGIDRDLAQRLSDLQRDAGQKLADLSQDVADKRSDIEYKLGQDRAKIARDTEQKQLDTQQDFADKRLRAQQSYQDAVDRLNSDFERDFAEADPFRRKILEYNRQEQLAQLEQQQSDELAALDDQERAALAALQAKADAELAIVEEQARRQQEVLDRETEQKRAAIERDAQQRREALERDAQQRREAAQQQLADQIAANERRRAELERSLAEEQAQRQAAAQQEIADLQQRHAEELVAIDQQATAKVQRAAQALQREGQNLADRRALIDAAEQRELQELQTKFNQIEIMEQAHLNQRLDAIRAFENARRQIEESGGQSGAGVSVGLSGAQAGGTVINNNVTVAPSSTGGYAGALQTGRSILDALGGF